MIFIDTETTGLNPHTDRVTLFQYKIDDQPTQLVQNPDLTAVHALLNANKPIIGHNLSFDFGFLKYIPNVYTDFEDTLYLDRIANYQADGHGLDAVAKRILGYDAYEGLDKKKLQKTNWAADELSDEQLAYAKLDVDILPAIYHDLSKALPKGLKAIYNFDKKSIIAGLQIQQHGLPVLVDLVAAELVALQRNAKELKAAIAPINPNSPKQVTTALGIPSSSDKVLAELQAQGNELAEKIRKTRSTLKQINFLEKLLKHDRFYGTLQPAARSGRYTSKQENIQNLPRSTKGFIGSYGNVILSADFAQLELRTVAAITEDETMIDLFIKGADLHDYAATQLFGPDFTKTQRQIAKVFNFATLYGSGAATIRQVLLAQTGISLPEHEVKDLKARWLQTFHGIYLWQRQGSTRHSMSMPWQTPHGRPYISERYTDHLSIENQGAGAEVARIALHYMLEHLPVEAKLFDFVHDSYWVEAPADSIIYMEAARVMRDAMKHAWDKAPFNKHGIPMPVDVGVAHNIKDADSLENCIYTLES